VNNTLNKLKTALVLSMLALAVISLLPLASVGHHDSDPLPGDLSEPDYCANSCHYNPTQNDIQSQIADEWKTSSHARSYRSYIANTQCAVCHSPFQGDADATRDTRESVPYDDWEGVTCGACHPSHDDRVEWGTPIGNYDVAAGEHFPVYEANELCLYCHDGAKISHAEADLDTQGYTQIMHKKGVTCVDCHMPSVPYGVDEEYELHSFHTPEGSTSCGLDNDDCHPNHTEDWAQKQIEKGMHEKGSYGQIKKGK
jgi:formate-dependent nitrite reductase cytochrome c552 subunit